jgi:hypothetical protein
MCSKRGREAIDLSSADSDDQDQAMAAATAPNTNTNTCQLELELTVAYSQLNGLSDDWHANRANNDRLTRLNRRLYHSSMSILITAFAYPGDGTATAAGARDVSTIIAAYAAPVVQGICNRCEVGTAKYGGVCWSCGASKQAQIRRALWSEMQMSDEEFTAFKATWPALYPSELHSIRHLMDICIEHNRFMTGKQVEALMSYALHHHYPVAAEYDSGVRGAIYLGASLLLFIPTEDADEGEALSINGESNCELLKASVSVKRAYNHLTIAELRRMLEEGLRSEVGK